MKLYSLYLKFTLQNALRFPRQATKVIPSLLMILIGLIWSIGIVINTTPDKTSSLSQTIAMLNPNIVYLIMLSLVVYGMVGKKAIINARASDANFLMPAPITPFQLHNFMEMKNMLSVAGMILLFTAVYGRATMEVLASNWLVYPLFFSMALSLYIFSFVNYISRTSKSMVGRYLKWIILVGILGYFALAFMMTGSLLIVGVLDINILMKYYPIIGWNMTLMRSIITLNIMDMLISSALLTATLIGVYYWAKSQDYYYYEEELAYIQKTEAAFKRAAENSSIDIKAKFVQTNRQLKQTGEKVLLDMAWLRAGKYWWMKLSLALKIIIIFVAAALGGKLFLDSDTVRHMLSVDNNILKMILLAYIGVLAYARLVMSNRKVDNITEDIYVSLMPFKPIYKLVYPQVVEFRLAILSTIGVLIALIAGMGTYINFNYMFFIYALIITLLFELFDFVRMYMLQPLTINIFLGGFFRQIVEILIVGGTAYLVALPLIYINGWSGIYLSVIILAVFIVLAFSLSVFIYTRIEKGKKSDAAY